MFAISVLQFLYTLFRIDFKFYCYDHDSRVHYDANWVSKVLDNVYNMYICKKILSCLNTFASHCILVSRWIYETLHGDVSTSWRFARVSICIMRALRSINARRSWNIFHVNSRECLSQDIIGESLVHRVVMNYFNSLMTLYHKIMRCYCIL